MSSPTSATRFSWRTGWIGVADAGAAEVRLYDRAGRFVTRVLSNFSVKVDPAARLPHSPAPIVIRGDAFYAVRSDGPGLDYVVRAVRRPK